MTRLARRIARWLTGHHPGTDTPHTDIDPYSHVLPPRTRNTMGPQHQRAMIHRQRRDEEAT